MKLLNIITEVAESKMFHMNFYDRPDHRASSSTIVTTYTFHVKQVAVDGHNRPIYVGSLLKHDVKTDTDTLTHCAVVTSPTTPPDHLVLAIFENPDKDLCMAAALRAMQRKRRGYGSSPVSQMLDNWTTFAHASFEVEDYEP